MSSDETGIENPERYMSDTKARAYRAYIDLRQTHLTDLRRQSW